VPELGRLDERFIHRPWSAPPAELARSGIELGRTYPRPIVDHPLARGRFLAAAEGFFARSGRRKLGHGAVAPRRRRA